MNLEDLWLETEPQNFPEAAAPEPENAPAGATQT
jgi:hypothetical protein